MYDQATRDFYSGQAGNGLPVYMGARRQLGGGFLSGLARMAVPIIKFLAPKAINFAKNTATGMLEGQTLGNAVVESAEKEIRGAIKRPAQRKQKTINKRRRTKTDITSNIFNTT